MDRRRRGNNLGAPSKRAVVVRLVSWLLFSASLALLPLLVDALRLSLGDEALGDEGFAISQSIRKGGLFIASAVLAAAPLAEAFNAGYEDEEPVGLLRTVFLMISSAASVILLGLNTAGFVMASADEHRRGITSASWWLYALTVIVGVVAVTVATRPARPTNVGPRP